MLKYTTEVYLNKKQGPAMFKKIISSLPFSPALVGQLSFYAKRLKKEEATRKIGLIFTALALVVQSFAVFQPPEAANASSTNDLIRGGFSTKDDYLRNYDANTGNLKDLFKAVGISRSDIENTKNDTWNSISDGGYSWGHLSRFSHDQGERSYTVPTSNGSTATFYYRPLHLSDTKTYTIKNGSTYEALVGKTSGGMRFVLLKLCGNLVLKVTPPPVPCPSGTVGTYPNCKPKTAPCPGDPALKIDDAKCKGDIVQTKAARNVSQGNVDATTVVAKANDKITYSLNVQNTGLAPIDTAIVEKIDDVSEYANIIDAGGASKSTDQGTQIALLTWPKVTLKAGEKITRMFTVQVMSPIPAMGKGVSNPTSYDCRMMNTFGNNVTIAVDCPVQKEVVETVADQLPHTGPTENMIVAGAVLAVVAFFYARARQLKTEVRLIRRDFNTGTI